MQVRSEFMSQLSLYLEDKLSLESFRDWQVREFSQREQYGDTDQNFLYSLESRYAEVLLGASENSFKEALRFLLPKDSMQSPVQYVPRYYIVSSATVAVEVDSHSAVGSTGTQVHAPQNPELAIAG